jgi:sterol-4alpha-carboxylate 3-dehydrogenase (decarboxylating)
VLELRQFQKDMSVPYQVPPGTSAQKGRDRLQRLLPKKTNLRYLVVGTGGVGGRLVELLHQRGETQVFGMSVENYQDLEKDLLDQDHYIQGDVTNPQTCRNVIQKVQPQVVFHTAAVISYAHRKPRQWQLSYNVNVKGVMNMLEASTDSSVKSFILTSSSTAGLSRSDLNSVVQGNEGRFPPVTSEEHVLSWYTRSKALAEEQTLHFCATHTKAPAFGIIRPASCIFHHLDPFTCCKVFQDMHAAAAGFERTIMDFVFNDNVCLGHLLLEQQLNAGICNGETFLISNQEPMTWIDFFRRVRAMSPSFVYWKLPSSFIILLATISELFTSLGWSVSRELGLLTYTTLDFATVGYVMDDSKAQKMLGYEPAFTVDEGILQMMENHQAAFPDGGLAKAIRDEKKRL